ncbi:MULTISPECIES: hypothetical protein [Paraburkholderia]|uniref:Uncharacterized protein n=1 Tax=Paraburkholderia podalyriae TaxID=1938811 RepID=A0ABR7PZ77_9BURK|nr:hypothetical protein [Paraburkholderia podalyriae]MBC8751489.1 hypothetical protein [Paraburkholderia podalyriae]
MRQATPHWLEKMLRDALRARRQMIRDGELLPEDEFRRRRGVTPNQLARLSASGSVFFIEVDGKAYYPRLLVDPAHNMRRLAYVCRILWPASPNERLHFLTSRSGALGGITPLQALKNDASYRELLILARGWASEFSRTIVKICSGEFIRGATLPVVCTGVIEIDPRVGLWRRAADALGGGGNLRPDGPYPKPKTATVFISRGTAGRPGDMVEARLDVLVSQGLAHTGVVVENYPRSDLDPIRVDKADDLVTVIRKILAAFR